jgi:hypothetical protein
MAPCADGLPEGRKTILVAGLGMVGIGMCRVTAHSSEYQNLT